VTRKHHHVPARLSPAIALALVTLSAVAASAATTCYDESLYPAVFRLERSPKGLRAVVNDPGHDSESRSEFPALDYSPADGWQPAGSALPYDSGAYEKKSPVPEIVLSRREAITLRPHLVNADVFEQETGAWTEHDGSIWFGISFYEGEGVDGVGGVGRYDATTHTTEIRRPELLIDSSIDSIVHDGTWLWFSTAGHYECIGLPPMEGLVRYDWNADRLETFKGNDDGPCGFAVHDLMLDDDYLWVATDLGLSRRERRTGKWEHFVPDVKATPPMRPATCEQLYTHLLETLPKPSGDDVNRYSDDDRDSRSQLIGNLQTFRPRFLAGKARTRPEQWTCGDLAALGQKAESYAALKTNVLRRRRIGSPDVACALEAFGRKKTREPEWRDLLLALLDTPGFSSTALQALEPFAGDEKVGAALVRRLEQTPEPMSEAMVLSEILSDRSVPALVRALDRFQQDEHDTLTWIIVALMRATKIGIRPDGTIVNLPKTAEANRFAFELQDYFDIIGSRESRDNIRRVADHWREWSKNPERPRCQPLPEADPAPTDCLREFGELASPIVPGFEANHGLSQAALAQQFGAPMNSLVSKSRDNITGEAVEHITLEFPGITASGLRSAKSKADPLLLTRLVVETRELSLPCDLRIGDTISQFVNRIGPTQAELPYGTSPFASNSPMYKWDRNECRSGVPSSSRTRIDVSTGVDGRVSRVVWEVWPY